MNNLLYQIISLLPSIVITGIIAYFFIRTKVPGLLLMLIASFVLTIVTAISYYLPMYIADRAMTGEEMQHLYTYIGIASLLAQTLLAVGLGIVLSRYPIAKNNKDSTSF